MLPNATGNCSTGPFIAFTSVDLSGESSPAKATVAACSWLTPAPEPTAL